MMPTVARSPAVPALPPGQFLGRSLRSRDLDGLRVTESLYARDAELPLHAHTHAYLSFTLEGSYRETATAHTRHCTTQTLLFHPAGECHANRFSERGGRVLSVDLPKGWLVRLPIAPECFATPVELRGGPACWLMRRLHAELAGADAASPLAVEGILQHVLAIVARAATTDRSPSVPTWVETLRAHLVEHFRSATCLDELAALVDRHPTHVSRGFRRAIGCTPAAYVRQLRLECARRQLAESDAPLTAIALTSGFFDHSHMCRAFRSELGQSPQQFRSGRRHHQPRQGG